MSGALAIQSRGVGKRYRLGAARRRHDSVRDLLADSWSRFWRRGASTGARTFWALRDASFDIRHGENVGLIGLNGAGKSTLLKILSRITRPTTGRIAVDGRVGALLEVGTGFHGELTGRENVFLYGSILGMTRDEVRRKFDAIVDFSGIEAFIDTPVKRYSSGMYVRLAFAVAAHLDPEILLLDEVLAVGDLTFQHKCMEFAKAMQQRDASIVFVSHNMFSIKSMCERVLYLRKGQIVYDGPTAEGIRIYEEDCRASPNLLGLPNPVVQISRCTLLDREGNPIGMIRHGEPLRVRIEYEAAEPVDEPNFVVAVMRADEVSCCNFSSMDDGLALGRIHGAGVLELEVPHVKLVAEEYRIFVLVRTHGFQDLVGSHGPVPLHVAHHLYDKHFGVFHEPGRWRVVEVDDRVTAEAATRGR